MKTYTHAIPSFEGENPPLGGSRFFHFSDFRAVSREGGALRYRMTRPA